MILIMDLIMGMILGKVIPAFTDFWGVLVFSVVF